MYKIALVEDEKNLANLVVKNLEAANYEVYLYHTGEEAISNIDKKVDLWILDIMLPGEISGFDLLKAIRHKGNNLPIILTSARDKDIDKIMG